jgi:hypothetical protein
MLKECPKTLFNICFNSIRVMITGGIEIIVKINIQKRYAKKIINVSNILLELAI